MRAHMRAKWSAVLAVVGALELSRLAIGVGLEDVGTERVGLVDDGVLVRVERRAVALLAELVGLLARLTLTLGLGRVERGRPLGLAGARAPQRNEWLRR